MSNPIRVFVDGACQPNPGKMGIGVVIEWQGSMKPEIISYYGGEGTNNIAEYMALREALNQIVEKDIRNVEIKSDSKLVVSQVNGKWRCKDDNLKLHCIYCQNKIEELNNSGFNVKLMRIPREFNLADGPAKNGCNN